MAAIHDWIKGYRARGAGPISGTQTASYSLKTLAEKGLLKREEVNPMLMDTQLNDFSWHLVWAEDHATADQDLAARIGNAEGYVIFIHGWTGSNAIWEDLPAMVVSRNPRLVSLVVDHNGFGDTPFTAQMPAFDLCNPVGAMRAIERWFELLKLRRQPGERSPKTINFVGHSMGGAELFFLQEAKWNFAEMTRLALAPALLLHDDSHRVFYTTLGIGIGLVGRLRALEGIDNLVSPGVLEALAEGATDKVKAEHARVYESTSKFVTARTFAAMGIIQTHPQPHHWELMKVVLGHRDRLVGLIPMLDLLQELDFRVEQIRVVLGTHYFFSVGEEVRRVHEQNRQIVLHDILDLHEQALNRQRTGTVSK